MEGECVKGEVDKKIEPKPKCNDDWRLSVDIPWALLCFALFLITLGVHYRALCNDRTDLSLPELMESMESQCRSLGTAFEQEVPETLLLHPVETQFGISVWVENETWALPVHDALDRIEKTVEDGLAAAGAGNNNNNNKNNNNNMNHGVKFIQRIVRVASFPHNSHKAGHVDDSKSKNHNRNSMSSHPSRNSNSNNRVEDEDALAVAAATQQLGLGVAKHAYALDLREELKMHGVSFFLSQLETTDLATVRCFAFEDRQSYCLVPANTTIAWRQREITAAIATLMSHWMNLRSFRDLNIVQQWITGRQVRGCQYGLRALRQLQLSVNEHPEMPAPYGVRGTVRRLQRLIDARMFAQFARAADDLQFHPLLLPQLYIPWDQALVNHVSILLPVLGMGILGVRLTVTAHRRKRQGVKLQHETTVDEKKNQ
ncbi:hypothetical protein LSM04_002077 [Trypanosoma melophagium]|uniref:uncharacterized protein n=1 Tax=Trypanosoma melophagium TaxID=715481 RepID=UPI00351A59B2|nr:hypothetical protein LSM04_002077 [Trypanosoma melophagium]